MRCKIALLLFLFGAYFQFSVSAQSSNYYLDFDGAFDYVDLGTVVGGEVRTIELWFNSDVDINSSLATAKSLIIRDNPFQSHEFGLTFAQMGWANAGALRFYVTDATGSNQFNLYSNATNWTKNTWYHVAVVIDSINGANMYIDGVQQLDNEPLLTSKMASSTSKTMLGCWGVSYIRYFDGQMEDVRLSKQAMYTSNFTPPCLHLESDVSTKGLWNFNAGSGIIATDSSQSNIDGVVYGASWVFDTSCFTAPKCSYVDSLDMDGCQGVYLPSGRYVMFSGSYLDTAHLSSGCTQVHYVNAQITTPNTQVIQSVNKLTAVASTGSFQWLDCDNGYSIILGETGNVFLASSLGSYALEVNVNGCRDTSDCQLISVLGIPNSNQNVEWNIFPNPAVDQLFIDHPFQRIHQMQVVDMSGKIFLTSNENQRVISLETIPVGMFMIQLTTEESVFSKKFIKQ